MTEVRLSTRDDCIYAAGLFDGEGSAVLTIRKVKNRSDAAQDRRPCFIWNTNSKNAGLFLADIAPFVRIKRDQVENALAFQATKRRRGSTPLSDAEWQTATDFLRRQRESNGRGKKDIGEVSSGAHGNK